MRSLVSVLFNQRENYRQSVQRDLKEVEDGDDLSVYSLKYTELLIAIASNFEVLLLGHEPELTNKLFDLLQQATEAVNLHISS